MPRPIDAVVAGHICFDVIPAFVKGAASTAELFRPGSLVQMGAVTTSTGGPVSNTGLAMAILGTGVELMGKVGDDFFGHALVERLREMGKADGMIVVPGEQTSYTIAIIPPGMDRMFLHNPGANNTFGADDVRYQVVETARLFHLGYPPLMRRLFSDGGAELAETFRRAKATGATTSLDMSLPDPASDSGKISWREILERTLPHVDLYVPSAEETLFMLEPATYTARMQEAAGRDLLEVITPADVTRIAEQCLALGPGVVMIKCGYKGIYIRTARQARLDQFGAAKPSGGWANRELWEPSFHVDPVAGATGSGDSSIAGFLSAYLRGLSIEESLRMANAVGGCNVTRPDAISGILPWDKTLAKIEAGWEKNPLDISAAGWRWHAAGQRYHGPKDHQSDSSAWL
jgi:sugar/nucleoside kinase (ribokinase family)